MGKKVTQAGCGGGGEPPPPRVLQQQQNLLIINYTKINKIFPLGRVGGFFLTLLGLTPQWLLINIHQPSTFFP